MLLALPQTSDEFMLLSWEEIAPLGQALLDTPLNDANKHQWVGSWSRLSELVSEVSKRLYIATTVNTTDEEAKTRLYTFLDEIYPHVSAMNNNLRRHFVASGVHLEDFEIPTNHMRADIELFREENLLLFTQEQKTATEYDEVIGAQTIQVDGEELTLTQATAILYEPDRAKRESVWRSMMERRQQDRATLNDIWRKQLQLRLQIAKNAGFDDYRSFRWQQMGRFDYTPADCITFQNAIEEVVVPAATRINAKRKAHLGVDSLRPWDTFVDPSNQAPLRPFSDVSELENKSATIFNHVDPELGNYFQIMRDSNLLDLANRKGKAPGAYCESLDAIRKPYIFGNAVGLHDDVQMLLHEAGHAFHAFECVKLPYFQQMNPPMEFAEVASMGMELLATPYLTEQYGGFYTEEEAARAMIEHLESCLLFWPYMAIVDAFQHWVYENPSAALDPENCDSQWQSLSRRFQPDIDWSGLDEIEETGWHRKLHIFQGPFYYVEYGLAQLGAVQIWGNALKNQEEAVQNYRKALSLGGIANLPDLFSTAGAKFAFDAETLDTAIELMESTIDRLERL